MDPMDVDVEPPVLASMTLANGETVYVELSSEGQRRNARRNDRRAHQQ